MIVRKKIEFGDFQTPSELAQEIVAFLRNNGEIADTIVEPTCGRGSFVTAAIALAAEMGGSLFVSHWGAETISVIVRVKLP